MGQTEEQLHKVLFHYHSAVLDEHIVETVWAHLLDAERGLYRLNSIPYYGPLIATKAEFLAEYDEEEEELMFIETVKHSGNSIVLVVILEEGYDREVLREEFLQLNCASEGVNDNYFSMEVLEATDYNMVKIKLDKYEQEGLIDYAEPCLSDKHSNEMRSLN